MNVFRVEHADGRGAYQGRWDWDRNDEPAYIRDLNSSHYLPVDPHPSPYDDGINYVDDYDYFACQSPELLLAWFYRDGNEDARRLSDRGMRIVVYQVAKKHIQLGGRQCTFRKMDARVVGRWDPRDFLKEFQPRQGVRDQLFGVL
ncbi:hypothetical protein SEA_NICKY22_51 [Microbacterium phage Nicky22]|nr:hypothetical protein SEA_NICKY22_51 [Microbacterium phage Nicky22]